MRCKECIVGKKFRNLCTRRDSAQCINWPLHHCWILLHHQSEFKLTDYFGFLPRDAILARYMPSSCVCLSECLSVCLSVILRYCIKTTKSSITEILNSQQTGKLGRRCQTPLCPYQYYQRKLLKKTIILLYNFLRSISKPVR